MSKSTALAPALIFLALSSGACSGGGGSGSAGGSTPVGMGTLVFEATDAPIDPERIERAVIEIDAVRVHKEADGETGFVTVYEGGPLTVPLTNLRNGLTQFLQSALLEAGSYGQVRLHVTDALLELKDGRIFSTRDDTIRLTSQGTSGYKIFLRPPVEVRENVETRVLLDFQLSKTFSPVPGNDLENARFFHLHPNIRVAVLQETGEVRGVVSTRDAAGDTIPAAGAAVYLLPPGESDPELAIASTLTEANGMAAILGVPIGPVDVLAVHEGRSGRADGLLVVAGAVASFEILVE